MADVIPTVPGMVKLQHKKTGAQSNHFPVDVREILTINAGEYDIVNDGSAQAARMDISPLNQMAVDRNLVRTEVTGSEGMVTVSMSDEEHQKYLDYQKSMADGAAPKDVASDPKAAAEIAKADDKTNAAADKAGTTAAAQKAEEGKSTK